MERRLIDRGRAMCDYLTNLGRRDTYKAKFDALCKAVDEAPTISAVEVVHCRECKHYAIDWPTGKSCCVRNGKVVGDQVWGGMVIVKDGYCNFGERREPDENAP